MGEGKPACAWGLFRGKRHTGFCFVHPKWIASFAPTYFRFAICFTNCVFSGEDNSQICLNIGSTKIRNCSIACLAVLTPMNYKGMEFVGRRFRPLNVCFVLLSPLDDDWWSRRSLWLRPWLPCRQFCRRQRTRGRLWVTAGPCDLYCVQVHAGGPLLLV